MFICEQLGDILERQDVLSLFTMNSKISFCWTKFLWYVKRSTCTVELLLMLPDTSVNKVIFTHISGWACLQTLKRSLEWERSLCQHAALIFWYFTAKSVSYPILSESIIRTDCGMAGKGRKKVTVGKSTDTLSHYPATQLWWREIWGKAFESIRRLHLN